ncbi:LPS O-antigen chain length determinant protein WzzB [Marinomonas sp. IMCC 4694]|uniref:LPS O-antigen chain length determinant protein WzzB n=1 Tax=Marinomonas sp. IMCC 4694 TaxID=2605432 RepID=UPI0011E742DF|nr:Wzz/FepE/Etk N-terminal domain-containing protein [Marinomonas sp. IMCC 4694]TYL46841.1 LPS chain length-determining protein [Marinomonas sp. IMCC 4694]
MTKSPLPQDQTGQISSLGQHQFTHNDDEIDLKELIVALWKGKLTIIAATVVCAVIAVVYALKTEEVWTAEAKIAEPQVSDFSGYQKMVSNYSPIFNGERFLLPETIFEIFTQQFEVRSNKKEYFQSSAEFQAELSLLRSEAEKDALDDAEARLYDEWSKKLTLSVDKASDDVTLQGIQNNAVKSLTFLENYVEYIEEKSRKIAIDNLVTVVEGKRSELEQQKSLIIEQASNKLQSELQLSKYALQIAKAAGVTQPQQNLGDQEIFMINIGSNALEAKVKVLDNLTVKQLNIIDPRLQQTESLLNLINKLSVYESVTFQMFRYIESPEKPLNRTAPKRSLIAVLGVLLGGMLGCFIVLVRFAFREKETV